MSPRSAAALAALSLLAAAAAAANSCSTADEADVPDCVLHRIGEGTNWVEATNNRQDPLTIKVLYHGDAPELVWRLAAGEYAHKSGRDLIRAVRCCNDESDCEGAETNTESCISIWPTAPAAQTCVGQHFEEKGGGLCRVLGNCTDDTGRLRGVRLTFPAADVTKVRNCNGNLHLGECPSS